jgi:hypothetical protein
MGAGGDGKPAAMPPLKVSFGGKDGTPNGEDTAAAKARHINQLMVRSLHGNCR